MLKEIPLDEVKVTDYFWSYYINLINDVVIPYQYQVLNDELDIDVVTERNDDSLPAGKSHALQNFKIAAGLAEGDHFGWVFQDSDVYKWLESVAYSLINQPNQELEDISDQVIELISQTQEKDGYLNTYYQLKYPELKYKQLYFSHELYCAGHMIEAAIAYNLATSKDNLLKIAIKNVNHILQHFGPESEMIHGADGHQEIELALVKLYEHTQNPDYLDLAHYFLDVRGQDPSFYQNEVRHNITKNLSSDNPTIDLNYLQAYKQPKLQSEAKGHAVRLLYMLIGMAKTSYHLDDTELLDACKTLWDDIVLKKMYITGAVGGTVHGEAFIGPYDLPNDTMYCETCASIALVNFSYEMFKITKEKKYLDVVERSLYNGVLAGASIDGTHFFYVNPLEVSPPSIKNNPIKGHVKTIRPDWLGCACCPPNFARTVASVGRYIYSSDEKHLYVNFFVNSSIDTESYSIKQISDFPYSNSSQINYKGNHSYIYIRIPDWADSLHIHGAKYQKLENGFIKIDVNKEVTFDIQFNQPTQFISANPLVSATINSMAIQRGPFIYCAEEVDNSTHLHLNQLSHSFDKSNSSISISNKVLDRTLTLELLVEKVNLWNQSSLYQSNILQNKTASVLTLIPYHLWGNRGENEMRVWFNAK